VAVWASGLSRKAPGLLLRDIRRDTPAITATRAILNTAKPDILLLIRIDYDARLEALTAFNSGLDTPFPYHFALPPNSGVPTGTDLDGDGTRSSPRDAQGYGRFAGQSGMALLSRFPIAAAHAQDFTEILWRDLPDALRPETGGKVFPSAEAWAIQRLSSVGHWVVPVETPLGPVQILAAHPTPPIYDGPEDRNGKRNHDEARLWSLLLNGWKGAEIARPILLTEAGIDPARPDHRPEALRALLQGPLRDVGPPDPTVTWGKSGPARSTLIATSPVLSARASGTLSDPEASRHALVWVDLSF
jgi:hypothetical protein